MEKRLKKIRFSIITVCKNCRDTIKKTIESVISQEYENIENIIADGGSTDGTYELIMEYADRDERIRYSSGQDNGIYDAMNKAAAFITGDYAQFINAGDMLYDTDTLSKVAGIIEKGRADIWFGDSLFCYGECKTMLRRYPQPCSWLVYYLLGDCINHQAIIASADCFSDSTFDTSYMVGSDRDWMIRMKKKGMRWKALGFPVVRYLIDEDSYSVKHQREFFEEVNRQTHMYFPPYAVHIGNLLEQIRKGKVTSKVLHFLSNQTIFRQD